MLDRRDIQVARLLAVALALTLSLSLVTASAQPLLHVTFLDVGQGDCALIRTPGGQAVLVDAGPPAARRVVVECLRIKGIKRLDCVIVSHPRRDHYGGLHDVVAVFTADRLCEGTRFDYPGVADIERCVARAGGGWQSDDGAVKADYIWPDEPPPSDPNTASVVFHVEYRRVSYLFTGDIPARVETELMRREGTGLDSDVLKVAHHGSRYSSSSEFLKVVSPTIAVISVGANSYGHPAQETLDRLKDAGAKVYRTGECGNITVSSNGEGLEVTTAKEPAQVAAAVVPTPAKKPHCAASAKSDKFHYLWCRYVGQIKPENLVLFATRERRWRQGTWRARCAGHESPHEGERQSS